MKQQQCKCDGKKWIRMPGTKAIIYCPTCEKPKILKRVIKVGTKIVSPTFGTGVVIEDGKPTISIIKVKMARIEKEMELDRAQVSYIYDQD
jgi:hypothetical protein